MQLETSIASADRQAINVIAVGPLWWRRSTRVAFPVLGLVALVACVAACASDSAAKWVWVAVMGASCSTLGAADYAKERSSWARQAAGLLVEAKARLLASNVTLVRERFGVEVPEATMRVLMRGERPLTFEAVGADGERGLFTATGKGSVIVSMYRHEATLVG